MKPTTRDDARREIESLLGPEGSTELAEAVLNLLQSKRVIGWEGVVAYASALNEAEWNDVLDKAARQVTGAK